MLTKNWTKATASQQNAQCVQVRKDVSGMIEVRDSKYPDGSILRYTPAEWEAFLDGAKKGEFDLPPH